jgi:hypothetical protein
MTSEEKLRFMISAGRYGWVSSDITPDRFLVEVRSKRRVRHELFNFLGDISSRAAVARMKKENFIPATHIDGLAYGAIFPER